MRLSLILTLSPLTIWCFGLTALLLFLLAKAAPAFLPTALSVALRPLSPFRQAQYAQVFPLKPASFCTLFAGFGNTIKSAIFLLFSYYLTLVLSSSPSFLLSQTRWQICQELSFLLFHQVTMGPRTSFSPENDAADELARRGALLAPSAILCNLLFLVSTLVFSRAGGVLSHLDFLTNRFPRFPPRNLCSLVTLAVLSLVYASADTAFHYALIFLG